ncbi:PREDICTED: probable G-protein coupled receptor B0563.6 [Priapulus caudatus]|uniref:Probable G-protein coupled receptor B0563.6 n=1 Tax=Priapulus caudatus TaxID=37621 RepID=A0ABM1F5T4_PRICU|nr:PREDICTED: probable G-protein coupled receptor B0563.6 [Priapulus caudatus]
MDSTEFVSILANFCTSTPDVAADGGDVADCAARRSVTYTNAVGYVYRNFFPIIIAVGTVGNALNLVVLWSGRQRELKAVSYVYLRALAVVDFSVIVVLGVYNAVVYSKTSLLQWSLADAIYIGHVALPLANSLICASNLIVLAATFDRYVSICHPLRARALRERSTARVVVIVAVVVAAAVHVPEAFQQYAVSGVSRNSTFFFYQPCARIVHHAAYKHAWLWTQTLLSKILPIAGVVGLNPAIVVAYRRSIVARQSLTQGHAKSDDGGRADRQLTALMVAMSSVFVAATLPAMIVRLIDLLAAPWSGRYCLSYRLFRLAANALEAVNYAANFYLYSLANAAFRRCLLRVVGCVACRPTVARRAAGSGGGTSARSASTMNTVVVCGGGSPCPVIMRRPAGGTTAAATAAGAGSVRNAPTTVTTRLPRRDVIDTTAL